MGALNQLCGFISCRSRLTKVITSTARGKREVRMEVAVRLLDVDTGRLSELKYQLICNFKLAGDIFGAGIRELVNELMGLDLDGYW